MRILKPYRVKLPDYVFVLLSDFSDAEGFEGPWDPAAAETQKDGSVALISDGLPVVLRVIKQVGQAITLSDGSQMRFSSLDQHLEPARD